MQSEVVRFGKLAKTSAKTNQIIMTNIRSFLHDILAEKKEQTTLSLTSDWLRQSESRAL